MRCFLLTHKKIIPHLKYTRYNSVTHPAKQKPAQVASIFSLNGQLSFAPMKYTEKGFNINFKEITDGDQFKLENFVITFKKEKRKEEYYWNDDESITKLNARKIKLPSNELEKEDVKKDPSWALLDFKNNISVEESETNKVTQSKNTRNQPESTKSVQTCKAILRDGAPCTINKNLNKEGLCKLHQRIKNKKEEKQPKIQPDVETTNEVEETKFESINIAANTEHILQIEPEISVTSIEEYRVEETIQLNSEYHDIEAGGVQLTKDFDGDEIHIDTGDDFKIDFDISNESIPSEPVNPFEVQNPKAVKQYQFTLPSIPKSEIVNESTEENFFEEEQPKKNYSKDALAEYAESESSLFNCNCQVPTTLKVSKKLETKGLKYFGCLHDKCNFVKWVTPVCKEHSVKCVTRAVKKNNENKGRHFFSCPSENCKTFFWAAYK